MREEHWGPWIEHDGLGCPLPQGCHFQAVAANGYTEEGFREDPPGPPPSGTYCYWLWSTLEPCTFQTRVVRYRVIKPKGVEILERIVAEPREAVPA